MNATRRSSVWIAEIVRWLSEVFVNEYVEAYNPARPPPAVTHSDEEVNERRQIVRQQFMAFVRRRS